MPEGIITDYDDELNGILVDERHLKVAVPGAIMDEKIHYHIEHVSPHQPKAWGRCDGLVLASPNRIKPPCRYSWPTSGACCGCPLMHIHASYQDELKKMLVSRALNQAGINYIRHFEYHHAPELLHYRNRTDLVAAEMRGRFVLGSYKNRSHDIVPVRTCAILRPPLNQVISFIVETANRLGIPAARQGTQLSGAIRYVSLFANDQGKVLVDLVCKSATGEKPAWLNRFAHELMTFKVIRGISWSRNDSPNNAIRVEPSSVVWGERRLPEHHHQIVSYFSASGFTQLNSDIAAEIYETARSWLPGSPDIVWDLYCGAGAFGRTIQPIRALYGAEFNEPAIDAARLASEHDPFETHFEVIDLEKNWPNHWPQPNVVLIDPPRKGMSKLMIQKLLMSQIPTLIYMSCNPVTFAQNAASLSSNYTIERFEAFDMMPQTRHVEVLGLLKRR